MTKDIVRITKKSLLSKSTTSKTPAPSTFLIPTSFVLCSALNEERPKIPRAVIKIARNEKRPKTLPNSSSDLYC